MTSVQHTRTFGRHTQPHTVIIARGDKIRHFTVRPWVVALSTALASAAAVGYFGTVAYVMTQDDMLASGIVRQDVVQQAYEERIASLRSQLDRAVSRQLLDQRKVETKVAVLLDQQVELAARYDKLEPLLDRARSNGLLPASIPVPAPNPQRAASTGTTLDEAPAPKPLSFVEAGENSPLARFRLIDRAAPGRADGTPSRVAPGPLPGDAIPARIISPDLLREIGQSMETVEDRQIENLDSLAHEAREKANGISDALRSEGIQLGAAADDAPAVGGEGGPFVAVLDDLRFDASYADLDSALTRLQALTAATDQIPLQRPVSTSQVSSPFGVRSDPFLGRSAMHTGLDFLAPSGMSVRASAGGTVVGAGPNGGYGQMVEIDHGDGVSTRYAHLSSIIVKLGDRLKPGEILGTVGSTGRSTGPHLHYEVRRNGDAVDPGRFLRAGRKIARLG